MKLKTVMMESSKNKFLNQIHKNPKSYDYYLGIIIEDCDDIDTVTKQCNQFKEKTEGHLQLLETLMIDNDTLLIFASDPLFYNSNVKGIVKSICKYINCEFLSFNYVNTLKTLVFDPWGEQRYFTLKTENKSYDLNSMKGEF